MPVQTVSFATIVSFLIFLASVSLSASTFQPVTDIWERRLDIDTSSCGTGGPISCHNASAVANLCCFEAPAGLLVQTQFWDTDPSTGPVDSWTIHGLWPDYCDGSFPSNCDISRKYNITQLLEAQGASDTLSFMQSYWVDDNGNNEQFWEHEWVKHGTCMSTLRRQCLPPGSPTGAEAVAFFQTVTRLFQTLPTYTWLSAEGFLPDPSTTYSLSDITSALKSQSGYAPAFDCTSGTVNQIYWYFNVQGSIIDGNFVPIDAPKSGSCPESGILYPPKAQVV